MAGWVGWDNQIKALTKEPLMRCMIHSAFQSKQTKIWERRIIIYCYLWYWNTEILIIIEEWIKWGNRSIYIYIYIYIYTDHVENKYKTVLIQQSHVLYLDAIIGEYGFPFTSISPLSIFIYFCACVINHHTIEYIFVKYFNWYALNVIVYKE